MSVAEKLDDPAEDMFEYDLSEVLAPINEEFVCVNQRTYRRVALTAAYNRKHPPVAFAPVIDGVPSSTDNPKQSYFTSAAPGYRNPQHHHPVNHEQNAEWLKRGPAGKGHCSWLFDPAKEQEMREREVGWKVRAEQPKSLAEVVPITDHPLFGKEGEPDETEPSKSEQAA